jgi:hypothetical protein
VNNGSRYTRAVDAAAWDPPPDPSRARLRAALQDRARLLYERLPPEAAAEVRASLVRLRKARSPRQAVAALEYEVQHLFEAVAPTLAEHPLPVATPRRAFTLVAVGAGSAATLEELHAISLLIPGVQAAAAPGVTVVATAAFAALVLEAYVAGSLRVHMLQAAGFPIDTALVTRDVLKAMTGRDDVRITKIAAKALTRRMLRRWARSIVPIVGISYATWDARKTIKEIARMPFPVQQAETEPLIPLPRRSS